MSAEGEAGELRACRLARARSVPLLYLLVVLVYTKASAVHELLSCRGVIPRE